MKSQHITSIAALFLLPVSAVVFHSCTVQENYEYEPAGITGKLNVSALAYFEVQESFTMLSTAINLAGLAGEYASDDIKTFIAPTDRAFIEYLESNSYTSLEDVPVPILKNLLKYHIVEGKVLFTDPELFESNRPIAYQTESGQTMYLSHNTNFVGLVNQGTGRKWEISTSNLEPTNGVIHVVSSIVYFSAVSTDLDVLDPSVKTDTIFPLADTYINGGAAATANFGSTDLLKVKNVTGDGDYDRKAYLMFDLNDFDDEGVITDLRFEIGVSFTHAKSLDMNLFQIPDTTWTEMGLNWHNATAPTAPPIATITTAKVSAFNFDLTDFYSGLESKGKLSLMIGAQEKGNETNDLVSKEHETLPSPMIIAIIATGDSMLEVDTNTGFSVESGGSIALNGDMLAVSGAPATDIIYTVEEVPQHGWLISGATILKSGNRFTQNDINVGNLVYISNDEGTEDRIILSAKNRVGAKLESFDVGITIL